MTEVEKFYEWMLKMGNIYLADNERMYEAFEIISKNNKQDEE